MIIKEVQGYMYNGQFFRDRNDASRAMLAREKQQRAIKFDESIAELLNPKDAPRPGGRIGLQFNEVAPFLRRHQAEILKLLTEFK